MKNMYEMNTRMKKKLKVYDIAVKKKDLEKARLQDDLNKLKVIYRKYFIGPSLKLTGFEVSQMSIMGLSVRGGVVSYFLIHNIIDPYHSLENFVER